MSREPKNTLNEAVWALHRAAWHVVYSYGPAPYSKDVSILNEAISTFENAAFIDGGWKLEFILADDPDDISHLISRIAKNRKAKS
jgi:hypothetical protein